MFFVMVFEELYNVDWHGEFVDVTPLSEYQYSNIHSEDRMKDMIRDIGHDSF